VTRVIKRFREGEAIPDGAKFLETTVVEEPTGTYAYSGPRTLTDYLTFAEYRTEIYRRTTYYIYEVDS
jgi:hypothetical protein